MIAICYFLAFVILTQGFLITLSLLKITDEKLMETYESKGSLDNKQIKLYILLPVFNEVSIVRETFNHFKMIIENISDVECIFITTTKEEAVFGVNKTRLILEELLVNEEKIKLLNYPNTFGNKPYQLNYCLEVKKDELLNDTCDTYICVYDADSRPSVNSFVELKNIIKKYECNVIQQPGIFNKNYNTLRLYLKLEACFQTRWSLGFERRNQFLSMNGKINKIFVPYAYCVGHGMIVKSNFLYKVGKYPMPFEDVTFGQKMMLMSEPIYPTVSTDPSGVVTSAKDLFNQSGNWIKAPLFALNMYKEVKEMKEISIYRSIIYFLKVAFDFFSWMQYFLFAILIAILSIRYHSVFYILFGVGVLLLECGMSICLVHKNIFKNSNILERVLLVIISPARGIFRGLSLFSYVKQKSKGWYYDKGRQQLS